MLNDVLIFRRSQGKQGSGRADADGLIGRNEYDILYRMSSCIDRRLRLRVVLVAPHMRSVARRMSINRLDLDLSSSSQSTTFISTSSSSIFHSSYICLESSYSRPIATLHLSNVVVVLSPSAVSAKRNPTMAEAKEIELLCNNLRCVADQTFLTSLDIRLRLR
jgi:hypothetical protein